MVRALAADPGRWRYGYELGREVVLKAGSLYPITAAPANAADERSEEGGTVLG